MTLESAQAVADSLIDWVGKELRGEIEKRIKNFDRKAGPGWVPTSLFPTRTLFDLYQRLVLRPISADLMQNLTELEVLHLEWVGRTLENVDQLDELFDTLAKILDNVSALPKDAKVAMAREESSKIPRSDKSVGLWQRFRRLVKKEG